MGDIEPEVADGAEVEDMASTCLDIDHGNTHSVRNFLLSRPFNAHINTHFTCSATVLTPMREI